MEAHLSCLEMEISTENRLKPFIRFSISKAGHTTLVPNKSNVIKFRILFGLLVLLLFAQPHIAQLTFQLVYISPNLCINTK